MGEFIGGRYPADSKATNDGIGCMVMPVYGKGKMGGRPILDSQGLGISTDCKDPKAAAAFLEYMESPERLQVFWEKTGWIPSSTKFDTSVIKDGAVKSMWKNWGEGDYPLSRQSGAGPILRSGPAAGGTTGRAGQDHR